MPKFLSNSDKKTRQLAAKLADAALSTKHQLKHALIIGLVGGLGAGKTTFIQGFAKALGIKKHLASPTFIIMRRHGLPAKKLSKYTNLYHIDTYRLHSSKDLLALGIKDVLKDSSNIVLIEWADKIKKILPKDTLWLVFKHGRNEKERTIKLLGN
ncbi:MAG: tRNA (adenosine(37)-N6)-threonylcarbamoyltransferase complex ATPase subunit type 1 TsaE [bacterium]|nr:tRNA (adenosine(37)-N6)-threonylcarbamoyltransferase complex ATPase subunit type 1 TsaE [bacterium]